MRRARREKRLFLRTDGRMDLSRTGRGLFVNMEKEAQERSARRLRAVMRVVVTLLIVAVAVLGILLFVHYFIPWAKSELILTPSSPSPSEISDLSASPEAEQVTLLDDLGLPIYDNDFNLFVINSFSPAPAGFNISLEETQGVSVDSRIVPALNSLCAEAEEDGLKLAFVEGYVSADDQKRRFESETKTLMERDGLTVVMARAKASETVPEPGESDFQTGLCLRLDADLESFPESRTCSWLKANMEKYGFCFRYPEFKQDATGMQPDLRVIRYVGAENAVAMQQRSLCVEEYITYLASQ